MIAPILQAQIEIFNVRKMSKSTVILGLERLSWPLKRRHENAIIFYCFADLGILQIHPFYGVNHTEFCIKFKIILKFKSNIFCYHKLLQHTHSPSSTKILLHKINVPFSHFINCSNPPVILVSSLFIVS